MKSIIYQKILFFVVYLFFVNASAQVSIKVTSIPEDTPKDARIYVAGNFNNWNPEDEHYELKYIKGIWSVEIPQKSGEIEFKFTRGDWSTAEGNHLGDPIPNRKLTIANNLQTIDYQILSWENIENASVSTAAWNVHLIQDKFYISSLERFKNIWIYLPPDYMFSNKNYPVIYMHDGQNIFDVLTSFSGEWKVDETLNKLFDNGDYGVIVVGIENGGKHRLNEYSPWINEQYGGGEGEAYVRFIKDKLKTYVDENYRTKPQAEFTALIGSSMGGLISTYAGLKFPSTFGKIAAMSPSYWFAFDDLLTFISSNHQDFSELKVYFNGSRNERESLENQILEVKNAWQQMGLKSENIQVKIDDYGGHNEAYWAGEFEQIYLWLFQK